MDRQLVYDTVGKAIKAASGKSFTEAQKTIAEAVLATEGTQPADTFVVESEIEPLEIPPSVVKPASRLTTLRPVNAPPGRAVVKQVWTSDQIQNLVTENTPEQLTFTPDGGDHEAVLQRIITADTSTPPSVQLSYRFLGADPDVSYPKKMLFTTDEGWDWNEIMTKLTKDAVGMYRLRKQPIVTRKVSTGGKIIIGTRAEV